MCLFFACHLSSLTSRRLLHLHLLLLTTYLFSSCTVYSIGLKSTMNRCLLEKLVLCWREKKQAYIYFTTIAQLISIVHRLNMHACTMRKKDIDLEKEKENAEACVYAFFFFFFFPALALTFRLLDWTITVNRVSRWKESSGFVVVVVLIRLTDDEDLFEEVKEEKDERGRERQRILEF